MKKFILSVVINLTLCAPSVVLDAFAEKMDTVDVIKSESSEMFDDAKAASNDMIEAGNEMLEEGKAKGNEMLEAGSEMLEESKDKGNDVLEAASDIYDDIKAKIQEVFK